jgi:hypothetical protein
VNRSAKFVLGGVAAFLVGNAIWNDYKQHASNPVTTANPADTHYASFGALLQSGTTPWTIFLGAALGYAASRVL